VLKTWSLYGIVNENMMKIEVYSYKIPSPVVFFASKDVACRKRNAV